MLPRLIFALVASMAATFVITQVIWPAIKGQSLFPLFVHWKEERRLAQARKAQTSAELNRAAARREATASYLNESAEHLRNGGDSDESNREEEVGEDKDVS